MVLILLVLAIAPGLALAIIIYSLDKYDKEPKIAIIKAFLLGTVGVIPACILELKAEFIFTLMDNNLITMFLYALIGVAFIEEIIKFFIVYIFCYHKEYFNEIFDGVVYTTIVSLGFATIENIFYVLDNLNKGLEIAILRAFLAVPGHALFGITMGYCIGMAKFNPQKAKSYFVKGIIIATALHGTYDFILFTYRSDNNILFFYIPFGMIVIAMWWKGIVDLKKARIEDEKRMGLK